MLQKGASSYSVLEGDDPAVYPLKPIYEESSVDLSFVDFFELFGPTHTASHRLAVPDCSYDTILCWETMEHFNFNPVKFVRELHRVLKPSGRVCITVPNRGSFQAIYTLLFGRNEEALVNSYFTYEDYESNGKKAFYGFHWREYTTREMAALFRQGGFEVRVCKTISVFQDHGHLSISRRLARVLSQLGTTILNRFGTTVFLDATRVPNHSRGMPRSNLTKG